MISKVYILTSLTSQLSVIKELNSYVALRKTYINTLGNKKLELLDAPGAMDEAEDQTMLASAMSNQQLIESGNRTMDETDQAIERSNKVVQNTLEIGTQTATALKGQTEQMGRVINELDTIQSTII